MRITYLCSHTFNDKMLLKDFFENKGLYDDDLQYIVDKTIMNYGCEEWRAIWLTTEILDYISIYAVIGVKMGIRALDELKAKHGDLEVVSSAGTKPPVSCLNDGLQVSTGATFGHGLITSAGTISPLVQSIFITNTDQYITLKLNNDINNNIQREISDIINHSNEISTHKTQLRKLAIHYWADLDRNKIFDIVAL